MEARMGEGEAEMALLAAGRTDVNAELHCSLANAFRHSGDFANVRNTAQQGNTNMSSRRNRSSSEAELIFETAFENGLLESKWQRFSITNGFHVRGLRSKPIWDVSETGKLEVSIR